MLVTPLSSSFVSRKKIQPSRSSNGLTQPSSLWHRCLYYIRRLISEIWTQVKEVMKGQYLSSLDKVFLVYNTFSPCSGRGPAVRTILPVGVNAFPEIPPTSADDEEKLWRSVGLPWLAFVLVVSTENMNLVAQVCSTSLIEFPPAFMAATTTAHFSSQPNLIMILWPRPPGDLRL